METKTLRNFIAKSPHKDLLNKTEFVFKLKDERPLFRCVGIIELYVFTNKQIEHWDKLKSDKNIFSYSLEHFTRLRQSIVSNIAEERIANESSAKRAIQAINEHLHLRYSDADLFVYGDSVTEFLLSKSSESDTFLKGAVDFLRGKQISNSSLNRDYLSGIINAYEFLNAGESSILKRSKAEKKNLESLKSEFSKYLNTAEQHLSETISETETNFNEHVEKLSTLTNAQEIQFETWFNKSSAEHIDFVDKSNARIQELEKFYDEKLRFSKPAEHWNTRARNLKIESEITKSWTVGISICLASFLLIILFLLGHEYFESVFNDTVKGIKWSLILVVSISFAAFLVKFYSKLTYSTIHLARDAEEREHLTNFYLSLKDNTDIDKEERKLIIQSLFSRSESGLLKNDASPTMPSVNDFSKVVLLGNK